MMYLLLILLSGPPSHKPLSCDPVCVVRYCEDRCVGPHRDRLQGLSDCKRSCVEYVTNNGCWPCKKK